MVHFMAKWSHFYDLPAVFLNITSKLDMLKNFFLSQFHGCTDISAIMPKKKDKFYITFYESLSYNTLKSHKKNVHTRLIP